LHKLRRSKEEEEGIAGAATSRPHYFSISAFVD
jgi:hypothetical protein